MKFKPVLLLALLLAAGFAVVSESAGANQGLEAERGPLQTEGHPVWADTSRNFRLPVTVGAAGFERRDRTAELEVNFTAYLSSLGVQAALDLDSLRVVEQVCQGDPGGSSHPIVIDADVPFQFDRAPSYDARSNAAGVLVFLLKGDTEANTERCYEVYFDVPGAGPFAPGAFAAQVKATDNIQDAGQQSIRIEATDITYFYHKQGGGFSSLNDRSGNDWISYSTAAGSAGEFRGIPNMVFPSDGGYFHPGPGTIDSRLSHSGPLKATIVSTTADNRWQVMWEIYPNYARLTVMKAGGNYWFLYEGTPGGKLDLQSDLVVRSDGMQATAAAQWTGDLKGEEWVYFSDPAVGRSLFLAHHEQDNKVDSYRQMEGNMTVFGFGRARTNRVLQGINHMTIGLADQTGFAAMSAVINNAYRDLVVSAGAAEARQAVGQATPTPTAGPLSTYPAKPTAVPDASATPAPPTQVTPAAALYLPGVFGAGAEDVAAARAAAGRVPVPVLPRQQMIEP